MEIADNGYGRQPGLMNRKEINENPVMLFVFPQLEPQSLWMRNALILLDKIFIDAKKEIVTVYKKTKTLSDQSYPSSEPAK